LLKLALGGQQVDRGRLERHARDRFHALGLLVDLPLRRTLLGFALNSLCFLETPVGLGANPLLLMTNLLDFEADSLFGGGSLVLDRARGHRPGGGAWDRGHRLYGWKGVGGWRRRYDLHRGRRRGHCGGTGRG